MELELTDEEVLDLRYCIENIMLHTQDQDLHERLVALSNKLNEYELS